MVQGNIYEKQIQDLWDSAGKDNQRKLYFKCLNKNMKDQFKSVHLFF